MPCTTITLAVIGFIALSLLISWFIIIRPVRKHAAKTHPDADMRTANDPAPTRPAVDAVTASILRGDESLGDIPAARIDTGVFKYVICIVQGPSGAQKHIVRGSRSASYHREIVADLRRECSRHTVRPQVVQILGGGRIAHHWDAKAIKIYGYSGDYGRPNHAVTAQLLTEAYPEPYTVTWSNDGY